MILLTSGGINIYADTLATGNFSLTNWTHIAVTSNSTTLSYYRNGVLINTATGTTSSGNHNMTFAKTQSGGLIQDNEGTNVTLTTSATTTVCSGMKVLIGATDVKLVQVEKYTGVAAATVCLANTAGECLTNATYSGNFATFSTQPTMTAATSYYILSYGSFGTYYQTGQSLPIVRDYISWSGVVSTDCNLDAGTTMVFDLRAMTVSVSSIVNNYYHGSIDEFGFWNRTLTEVEIQVLSEGVSYGGTFGTTTTLNIPTDNANSTTSSVT